MATVAEATKQEDGEFGAPLSTAKINAKPYWHRIYCYHPLAIFPLMHVECKHLVKQRFNIPLSSDFIRNTPKAFPLLNREARREVSKT
eukprot:4675893-Pyramimonas_sp.AAC.1